MAGFPMKERQRIIDEYLAKSGNNLFQPAEFVDWLCGQPEHEAYQWFYGTDDATAAREHRIQMARQMANGLRIRALVSKAPAKAAQINVAVREFPAMISPVSGRKEGGGYQPFDPGDTQLANELRRQGAQALRSWLSRYRGVAEQAGIEVDAIEEIAAAMSSGVADAA